MYRSKWRRSWSRVLRKTGAARAALSALRSHRHRRIAGCAAYDHRAVRTVDVLVNNAGDDTRHSIAEVTPESWDRRDGRQPEASVSSWRRSDPGDAEGGPRLDHQYEFDWLGHPLHPRAGVCHGESRHHGDDAHACPRTRPLKYPGELRDARLHPDRAPTAGCGSRRSTRRKCWPAQALKRFILPEEVARLVLFLAADDSSAITNQSYVIDGGWV